MELIKNNKALETCESKIKQHTIDEVSNLKFHNFTKQPTIIELVENLDSHNIDNNIDIKELYYQAHGK